jgi:serine/threonine protein kinase
MEETAEVLDVLAAEHGLQHLDIKPENLFLMSGHIKVADFGLVQSTMSQLNSSALAFTPAYAPPELFNGHIAKSADQYSLAVTYQELLTGQRPFAATSFRELVFAHDNLMPNVEVLPTEERPCLLRALNKRDEERFPNCMALVQALQKASSFENKMISQAPTRSFAAGSTFMPTSPADRRSAETSAGKSSFRRMAAKGIVATGVPPSASTSGQTAVAIPQPPERRIPSVEIEAHQDKVVSTFLACVTPEIYAWKLRAFIDAMNAELEGIASFNETLLRFRPSRNAWFGRRTNDSVFLKVETVGRPQSAGTSIVHVTVYCSDRRLRGPELTRRAMLLIRALKSFLMASEKQSLVTIDPVALRAELWATESKS